MFDVHAFLLLPTWYQYLIVAVFGAIIGSFLNVVIYRFNTGKSLKGSSHCLSCGAALRWFELFPIFSYLAIRGRCLRCGCGVPGRYFIVETLTALLYLVAYCYAGLTVELIYLWFSLAVLVVLLVYDIRHFIIPDSLTITLTITTLLWYSYRFATGISPVDLGIDILAAVAGAGFFFLLWLVSKGRWIGFGDVKLAFPLGLMVGADLVFSMVVFSFWIGAVVSLLLLGAARMQRGKLCLRLGLRTLTIKSVVPFAPFMVAGCLLTLFASLNVLSLFTI